MSLKVRLLPVKCADWPYTIAAHSWYKGILVSTMLMDSVPYAVVLTNMDEFELVPLDLLESSYVNATI